MQTDQELKEIVKQKYSEIALQDKDTNQSSCCGSGCCSTEVYNIMTDDYSNLQGYNPDADLGLGCGLLSFGFGRRITPSCRTNNELL